MPNLAIYLGYDRPAGTRQLAGTLPPLPIPGFIAGGCDRIPSKYGIPAISCLSVLLCRTATHSSCRHPNIEHPPEIIGECGQAELGANLLQTSHQKRTLVHPLLDRAKRVLNGLAALVEDVGALHYAGLHAVQYGLVLETGHGAELIGRALRADRAVAAGLAVAVIDLLQAAQKRRRIGMKMLSCWTEEAVAGWVVAELIFAEQAGSDRGTTLGTRHVRVDPGL